MDLKLAEANQFALTVFKVSANVLNEKLVSVLAELCPPLQITNCQQVIGKITNNQE